MDELTHEEKKAAIKALLNDDEEGHFQKLLEDLPFWWAAIPPDERDPNLPDYLMRDTSLISYSNWAFTKPWAWEGLRRLLDTLLERREPIPEFLQEWANNVASGRRKPPEKLGRREKLRTQCENHDSLSHISLGRVFARKGNRNHRRHNPPLPRGREISHSQGEKRPALLGGEKQPRIFHLVFLLIACENPPQV